MSERRLVHHQPEGVWTPRLPMTNVVTAAGFAFVSGQIGIDAERGELVSDEFEPQMRQVMENHRAILASVGCTFADVVKVNTFLAHYDYADEYNRLYREYFSPPYPARRTMRSDLPGYLIEVDLIAALPEPPASLGEEANR